MKKLLFLWLALLLMLPSAMRAQDLSLTVADGTVTNEYIPIYGWYLDSECQNQIIYPESMLEDMIGGSISSITFYMETVPTNLWTHTFQFSLGTTTLSDFSAGNFVTGLTNVYSGTISVASQFTVTFTTPFNYEGGNLVLEVTNFEGGYSRGYFYGVETDVPASRYSYVSYSTTANNKNFIPKTTFTYTGGATCKVPGATQISGLNTNVATLTWSPRGTETAWDIYFTSDATDIPDETTVPTYTATDTFYNFNGLTSSTSYYAYVRANCGSGDYSSWKSVPFRTPQIPAQLPYWCDFEDPTESSQWSIEGNGINQWTLGTAVNATDNGAYALYVSCDTGATNNYINNSSSLSWAYRDIDFGTTYAEFNLSFKVKIVGESESYDYLRVYLGSPAELPTSANYTGALPANATFLGVFSDLSDWTEVSGVVNSDFQGIQRLYLLWWNDGSGGDNPAAAVDDLSITGTTCGRPSNLALDSNSVTTNSIYFHFSPALMSDNAWEAIILAPGDSIDESYVVSLSDTTHTFTGLEPNTLYRIFVRTDCGVENSYWSEVLEVRTSCTQFMSIPFVENFSDYGTGSSAFPQCWERNYTTSSPYPYISADNGATSLYFSSVIAGSYTSAGNSSAILPEIDTITNPINSLSISFKIRKSLTAAGSGALQVGVMSDPTDFSTFTAVQNYTGAEWAETNQWYEVELPLTDYTGYGSYIAFRKLETSGNSTYIDDVEVFATPNCLRPMEVAVAEISDNSVSVSWTSRNEETEWQVAVVPAGSDADEATPETVTSNPCTILNLADNTEYDVYVKAVCGSGETSEWALPVSFRTRCLPTDVIPYTENFEGLVDGENAFPSCWSRNTNYTSTTYPYVDDIRASEGDASLYFYASSSVYSIAASQALDLSTYSANTLRVTFKAYKTNASYGRMDVGFMTDPDDLNTFTAIKSIYPSDFTHNQWCQFDIPVTSAYQNGNVYLALYAPAGDYNYVYIDEVALDYQPNCSAPSNLIVSNVAGTSALLSWDAAIYGNADYSVEYSEVGMDSWNIAESSVIGTSYMLSGLNPQTAYDVRVSSNCATDDSTFVAASFSTLCLSPGAEVTIGNGDTESQYLPSSTNWGYSLTQQLFNATEVGTATTLTGIKFEITDATSQNRNWDIYLGNTSQTALTASTYISTTNQSLVFSGVVSMEEAGWVEINFSTPFAYTGENLVLTIDDNTGSFNGASYFASHSGNSLYKRSDSENFNPASATSFSSTSYRNNVILMGECDSVVTCVVPNMIVTDITDQSITVNWAPGYQETSWELEYKGASDAAWTSLGTTSAYPYTLDNLAENTEYQIRLRSECGGSYSDWTSVSAQTECVGITELPYIQNFDAAEGSSNTSLDCWFTGTNNSTPYPRIDDAQSHSPNSSLHFYATSSLYSYATTPRFSESIDMSNLQISFYARKSSENYMIEVGIMSDPNDYSTFEMIEAVSPEDVNVWGLCDVNSNSYSGNGRYVAFRVPQWFSNMIYIDNVDIHEIPFCGRVEDIVAEQITSSSATISWTPAGDETSWEVLYGPVGAIDYDAIPELVVGTPSIQLSNLISNTGYDVAVRALCTNGEMSAWTSADFRTGCGLIASIPFVENFETFETGSSAPLYCWTKLSTSSTTYPYVINTQSVSGSKSLYFSSSNSNYNLIATPQLDPSISVSSLEVTLQMNASNVLMKLIVGVLPNIADASSFVPVDTLEVPFANQWGFYNVPLNSYTGTGSHIAFKSLCLATSSYTTYSLNVDDIEISYMPTCARPYDVEAISTPTDMVQLSWSDTLGSQWEIIYGPTGFDPETSVDATTIQGVTSTTHNVQGLSAGIVYDFYVRSICGNNEVSPWCFFPAVGAPYTHVMTAATDTITACGITVTDNGGIAGNYMDNSNNILVIYPTNEDSLLTISGTFVGETSTDYLSIYKGVGISTDKLLQKVISGTSGNLVQFGPLESEEGPLTLMFHSDFSNVYQGFIATVNCVAAPSCRRVTDLRTVSITSNTATIEWSTLDNNFVGFNIAVATQPDFNPDTCTLTFTSTTTNVQVTGLSSNTLYYVKVQSSCGGDDVSLWSDAHTFMTAGNTAQIPYFADFTSDSEVQDWILFNGTETNKWHIGTPSGMSSPKLYISNDNGMTNAYTISSATSNVWACRDIEFGSGFGEYKLSFNWKAQGESTYDYMRVYIGDPIAPENSITPPAGAIQISPDYLNLDSTTFRVSLDASYANTIKRLYFFWHNDFGGGSNPPASIDSIQIVGVTCGRPYNLHTNNITQTAADIAFTPAMVHDNAWEYVYGAAGSDPDSLMPIAISDTLISLSGLTDGTPYNVYVRTVCGAGEYSDWSEVCAFFTHCGAISTLPYTETFDNYGVGTNCFPLCWFKQSSNTYPYINATNYTGPGSLYFYTSSGNYNIATTPEINTNILTLSTLQVNFWFRPGNASSKLIVGVMTDPNDASTFVVIDSVSGSANTWSEHTVYLAAYNGTGRYVAFKSEYNNVANYGYLDNVTIDIAPNCLPVMGISASNISESSATISWTDLNNATSWNIEFGPSGFTQGQGTAVTDITNPYTITGLTSNTMYEVYVQSNCDAAETSDWTGPFAFRTACGIINNLPYTEDFDSYTAGSTMTSNPSNYPNDELPSCWSFLNRSTVSGSYPAVFLSSYSSYAVLGNCLFFKSSNTTPLYAILPDFAANIQDLKVTFSYRNEGVSDYNGVLSVGYMTDLDDASTFTEVSSCLQTSAMTENTVLFNTVPTSVTDAYIVFKYTGGTSNNYFLSIDNVVVDYAQPVVTCDAPTNVQVTAAQTSAAVTWTSTADAWVVEYKEATAENWTASATLTANNYNITGLTAATDYVVRVKAICDTDTESDWSAEVPFTTLAGEVTTYTITATATGPGTITPNGTVTVTEGENATFAFAANAGAVVDRLLVDDAETTIPANNEYTFSNVVANHTIAVEFVEETGIEEIDLNAAVVLYPNPATSQIQIQVADSRFLGAEMQIFDVYGKLISNATIETLSTQVDVSQLANGMYMVRINAAEGMVTKRFVKR